MSIDNSGSRSGELDEMAGLAPIVNLSMADQVEERLRAYFKNRGFLPGDPLPKESELADALNVSRNVIREALSRLRMLGMVDSRKRRGMVLTEPDVLSGLDRIVDSNLLSLEAKRELFELRLVIELGLGDLLFLRMDKKKLAVLDKIVEEEEKHANSPAKHSKYEVEFHGMLYQMTGNKTLYRFQKMLIYVFEYAMEVTSGLEDHLRTGSVSHRDLVEILRNGNPEDFRTAMRKHLEPYFRQL
jgi:GntR family transcriptional regulator, transcriptional repressor for pyruvate dehydrogenase complex